MGIVAIEDSAAARFQAEENFGLGLRNGLH